MLQVPSIKKFFLEPILSFTVLLLIHWTFFSFVQLVKSRNGCAVIIIKSISYFSILLRGDYKI